MMCFAALETIFLSFKAQQQEHGCVNFLPPLVTEGVGKKQAGID